MAEHIPFISSKESFALALKYYKDSPIVRIPLDKVDGFANSLPSTMKLWLDPCVDGFDNLEQRQPLPNKDNKWFDLMHQFTNFEKIGSPDFWIKPDSELVGQFVNELLDYCLQYKPTCLTVPQIPLSNDSSRNKINLALAKATAKWKKTKSLSGCLILPLVFTHQKQLNAKTERNPKVKQACRCYNEAQADGIWVVDNSLTDDGGSGKLLKLRLPGIVDFHTELNAELTSRIRIAGPYWGLNIVLWARGLVNYPAIGIGNSYHYFLAGSRGNTPSPRLAIPPLRRRVGVAHLGSWLDATINTLGVAHPATPELAQMRRQLDLLRGPDTSRDQVAKFYKLWLDLIGSTPQTGRSMALFQDLSSAYALGRSLDEFKDEGTARRPEAVVEPYMLNCL